MSIRSRIEALERRYHGGGSLVLHFADGSKHAIPIPPGPTGILDLAYNLIDHPDSDAGRLARQSSYISVPESDGHLGEFVMSALATERAMREAEANEIEMGDQQQ